MPRPVTCVVPARLGSVRFPRKLLQPLLGKPIIAHTLERASEAGCFDEIICFTDSMEIADIAIAQGFRFFLTGEAANGTDRIAHNLAAIATDLVVNLQGDEPAFPIAGLRCLCSALEETPEWAHVLVHAESPTETELADPNRVKTALNEKGFVSDFYRVTPTRPSAQSRLQLGAYGYSKNFLRRYAALPPSQRELWESHELLRDLNLAPVRAHASTPGASVDVPADLNIALARVMAIQESPRHAPQGVWS
jgi:3-deoxy-manno-octulosonate cytidylyltransferase (CMP-KDO synthetase)